MKPDREILLAAVTAKEARREIRERWPQHQVEFTGYDEDGMDVFMSCVRKQGHRAAIATARRNRSKPPIRFVAKRWS